MYTLRELASILNVSYRNIQRWIKKGWITPTNIHKFETVNRYFFDDEAVKKIKKGILGKGRVRGKIQ